MFYFISCRYININIAISFPFLEKTRDWFLILSWIIWICEVRYFLFDSPAAVPILKDTAGSESHRRAVAGDGSSGGETLQLVVTEPRHVGVRLAGSVAKQTQGVTQNTSGPSRVLTFYLDDQH